MLVILAILAIPVLWIMIAVYTIKPETDNWNPHFCTPVVIKQGKDDEIAFTENGCRQWNVVTWKQVREWQRYTGEQHEKFQQGETDVEIPIAVEE